MNRNVLIRNHWFKVSVADYRITTFYIRCMYKITFLSKSEEISKWLRLWIDTLAYNSFGKMVLKYNTKLKQMVAKRVHSSNF